MPTYNPSIASKTSPRPSPAGGCFFVFVPVLSQFYLYCLAEKCLARAVKRLQYRSLMFIRSLSRWHLYYVSHFEEFVR
jgi:hypothetical protein